MDDRAGRFKLAGTRSISGLNIHSTKMPYSAFTAVCFMFLLHLVICMVTWHLFQLGSETGSTHVVKRECLACHESSCAHKACALTAEQFRLNMERRCTSASDLVLNIRN